MNIDYLSTMIRQAMISARLEINNMNDPDFEEEFTVQLENVLDPLDGFYTYYGDTFLKNPKGIRGEI